MSESVSPFLLTPYGGTSSGKASRSLCVLIVPYIAGINTEEWKWSRMYRECDFLSPWYVARSFCRTRWGVCKNPYIETQLFV